MSADPQRAQAWTRLLAARFDAAFPDALNGPRTIGREAEFPVVHPDGQAADIAEIWAPLLARCPSLKPKREGDLIVAVEDDAVCYSAEVGHGTIEVIVGPDPSLRGIQSRVEAALDPLLAVVDALDLRLLGYGIQPLTPATPELMTPKQRYGVLLQTIGQSWLWFTVTASDQVHLDLNRGERVAVTDLCNLLTGVVVALCGNSSVHGGAASGWMSSREAHMGQIHAGTDRHGMPRGPDGDTLAMIRRLVNQELLIEKREGVNRAASGLFIDRLCELDPSGLGETAPDGPWEDFLLHEHYIWNSARPRTAHGTLELRSACQQPLHAHMAASALGAGLVEAAPALAALVKDRLGDQPWAAMRRYHHDAVRLGLAATEPAPGFLSDVLDRCEAALAARGWGEEALLAPHRRRLAAGANPAQDALAAFERGGVPALVALTAQR